MPASDDGLARCDAVDGAAGLKPAPALICVDPAWVADFWPHARELIRAAMRRGDLSSFADVEASVLAGDALLWLAWSAEPNGGNDRHVGAGLKPAPTPQIEAAPSPSCSRPNGARSASSSPAAPLVMAGLVPAIHVLEGVAGSRC